jgi:hypothetical protein
MAQCFNRSLVVTLPKVRIGKKLVIGGAPLQCGRNLLLQRLAIG